MRDFQGLSRVPGKLKNTKYRESDAMWILYMSNGHKYYCPALAGADKPAKRAFRKHWQAVDYRVAVLTKYIALKEVEQAAVGGALRHFLLLIAQTLRLDRVVEWIARRLS